MMRITVNIEKKMMKQMMGMMMHASVTLPLLSNCRFLALYLPPSFYPALLSLVFCVAHHSWLPAGGEEGNNWFPARWRSQGADHDDPIPTRREGEKRRKRKRRERRRGTEREDKERKRSWRRLNTYKRGQKENERRGQWRTASSSITHTEIGRQRHTSKRRQSNRKSNEDEELNTNARAEKEDWLSPSIRDMMNHLRIAQREDQLLTVCHIITWMEVMDERRGAKERKKRAKEGKRWRDEGRSRTDEGRRKEWWCFSLPLFRSSFSLSSLCFFINTNLSH